LAIVGSRSATRVGCDRAYELAAAVGRRGWAVMSGGAFGIDAAAHEGALAVGAATYAVLGCGVDIVYPDRHEALFARIATQGGLLAELAPGTPPARRHFPARNRIISALSDAVVVVEAAVRSGALITAGIAHRRGQRVLAMPGSRGTDELLATGKAVAVTSVAELDEALAGRGSVWQSEELPSAFVPLVAALRAASDTPGGLARRLGLPLPSVMSLLLEAELEGWVRRAGDTHYEVLRAH